MIKKSFNEKWFFKPEISNMMNSINAETNEKGEYVTLPHDAMINEYRNEKNPTQNAGAYYPGGDYSYMKEIDIPKENVGKNYVLEFEGIYNRGMIYVNGTFVQEVSYGYTRLICDITPYIFYGGKNTVLVKVTNSDVPNSRWYTGSGLYRPVNMYIGSDVRIPVDGTKITTSNISENETKISTNIKIEYDGKTRRKIRVNTKLLNREGQTVAEESTPLTLFQNGKHEVQQKIYMTKPSLWSVESPYLYTCKVEILEEDKVIDTAVEAFGIRKMELSPKAGLKINEKEVLLRGACIHHDNGVIGAAAFKDAEERKVLLLKKAGFNAIRVAHNTASKDLLSACDQYGMLVMDESFDMWTNAKSQYDNALLFPMNWESIISDMVNKDYNHPSVIMYSIGNEIQEIGTPKGADINRQLVRKVKELDSTRIVTNAINGLMTLMDTLPIVMKDLGLITEEQLQAMASNNGDDGDINDAMTALMGQMNYLTSHPSVENMLEESFSELDAVGLNYMRDSYEIYDKNAPNRITFGSETFPPDIDLNWEKVKTLKSCIGDFTWTGLDYLGEAGVGVVEYDEKPRFFKPYPCYLAYCGDIDLIGNRRPISYYREIVWGLRKNPYIAVQYPAHYGQNAVCTPWSTVDTLASWSWNGYEGKKCIVEVYADTDEVELLVNGHSKGRKPVGEKYRYRTEFEVEYEPGVVQAVSYKNNIEIGKFELKTAGEEQKLHVITDKTSLKANNQDLAYISINITDQDGVINTSVDEVISVEVSGNGRLLGLGNADPYNTENFFDKKHSTFNGSLLAVIQSGKESGRINIALSTQSGMHQEIVVLVEEDK